MRLYMQKELVERALAKAGSVKSLAAILAVSRETIYRWQKGHPMVMASAAKLKEYIKDV